MKTRFMFLVLAGVLVIGGCAHREANRQAAASHPLLINPALTVPEYASQAIEAAGGRQGWIETGEIEFDGVVTIYKADETSHLTEHHFKIRPWENSITISSQEPQGLLTWQLSRTETFAEKMPADKGRVPDDFLDLYYTQMMLDIITAPVRMLDAGVSFVKEAQPTSIKGQDYDLYKRTVADDAQLNKANITEALFHQNQETHLIEIIRLSNQQKNLSFTVQGHDYEKINLAEPQNSILIPSVIEIFGADAMGFVRERLMRIDIQRESIKIEYRRQESEDRR